MNRCGGGPVGARGVDGVGVGVDECGTDANFPIDGGVGLGVGVDVDVGDGVCLGHGGGLVMDVLGAVIAYLWCWCWCRWRF